VLVKPIVEGTQRNQLIGYGQEREGFGLEGSQDFRNP